MLIAGTLLLVLAVFLLIAQIHHHPRAATTTAQRLRLEETLSRLDTCLTCHEAPQPVHIIHEDAPAAYARAASEMTPVHAELIDLGERLLALPDTGDSDMAEAVDEFVALADQALNVAPPSAVQLDSTLARLAALENLVRSLEHRTSPDRWSGQTVPVSEHGVIAAAPGVFAPALALIPAHLAGPPPLVVFHSPRALPPVSRAVMLAYEEARRGPPAAHGDVFTFGLLRRLPFILVIDAQSSFCDLLIEQQPVLSVSHLERSI